jgi:transposase, IS6 family
MALGSGICTGNSEAITGQLKYKRATWFMDEDCVRVAGRWMYLFRAVDNRGDTVDFQLSETRDRDAAKRFLQTALANPHNRPRVFY